MMSMIFKFRVLIADDEDFIRDYELPYDATLTDFHNLITKDLKFEDNDMASFFESNEEWEKLQEYTLVDMDVEDYDDDDESFVPIPMDDVTLGHIVHAKHQRLIYVYDILNDSSLFITLMESKKEKAGEKYPKVATSKGKAPKKPINDDDIIARKSAYNDIMSDFDDDFDADEFSDEFGSFEEEEYY